MKNLYLFVCIMVVLLFITNVRSQDHIPQVYLDFYCGELNNSNPPPLYPYFQTDNDTLKVLVVFCNFPFPDGNFDIPNTVYLQHWPGSSGQTLPSWADSIICPTTTNVWDRSLTALFRDASRGKFWLIGDVYPELYVFEHDIQWYKNNGASLGVAIKELLENIDGEVDFSDYDRLDPRDIDDDNNRREPDGKVDFIFINFRFNNSSTIEFNGGQGYSGIANLGGNPGTFGGLDSIILDGKEIEAGFPGSGAIYEMWTPWHIGVPAHEFGQHYSYGPVHSENLGAFNISGGGLASAFDREWLSWNTTAITPTSNTQVTLRDYVTTGDYIKIPQTNYTIYLENRRRITYFTSEEYRRWKWLASEPYYPAHSDSMLWIYRKANGSSTSFYPVSAKGNFNWQKCTPTKYKNRFTSPTFNFFLPDVSNRNSGLNTFQLSDSILTENCNTVIKSWDNNPIYKTSYMGIGGDSSSFFDVGYNEVYSPWSNPPVKIDNQNDSLTIEIVGRDDNGDLVLNIYFTNMPTSSPSKPQDLRLSQHFTTPQETIFNPQLDWGHNLEPDHDYYKIYRGAITTPGVDPTYYYIGYTRDTTYIDENVDLYVAQGGSGICTYQYKAYSYRVTAIDQQELESVRSEKDTIWGYSDPCAPEDNLNTPSIELDYGLLQNYPNPFNPTTMINYSLKEKSFVSLKIFNILGQEVERLVYGVKDKGNYSVAFNTENKNFSSGIYFYKLEVTQGNFTVYSSVKRMVLIK